MDRPSNGSPRLLPRVVGIGFGMAAGLLLAVSNIDSTIVYVVFGVYWFLFALARLLGDAPSSSAPDPAIDCARCAARPRTLSGYCPECTALLESSPLPASHPAYRVILALEGGAWKSAAPGLAPKLKRRCPRGAEKESTRGAFLRDARLHRWKYPRTGTILGLSLDPANADNVWVRTHDFSSGRLWYPELDLTVVARYRMPHEQIVEIEVYDRLPRSPALAPSGAPPATSLSAPGPSPSPTASSASPAAPPSVTSSAAPRSASVGPPNRS